jgi:tRNA nucleotidyltransferase (CCA-adding enzyme)
VPNPETPALPAGLARRLAAARRLARQQNIPLYLVGGAVRDLYLRRPIGDVDLVVEGDAVAFAQELARDLGAKLALHGRFGTAVVTLPAGGHLDLAGARTEEYDRPGALPSVQPAPISEDLRRRDFTVNAMALEVGKAGKPALLDPFGGRADLRRKVVRMLHPRSPFDDFTRSLRAVRYANRLGFAIERQTRAWIRSAAASGAADAISGDRLRRELLLVFSEKNRAAAVREMASLGISRTIHPRLRFDPAVGRRLRAAERLAAAEGAEATGLVYLLSWMGEISPEAAVGIAGRLNLPRASARAVREWPAFERRVARAVAKNEDLAPLVEGRDDDSVLAVAAIAPPAARRRILAAARAGRETLGIAGRDLVAAGIPAGPAIGRALAATLTARRRGKIGKEDELAFALEAARS